MTKQGVLPFRYECEPTASGTTALGGLPPYLELVVVSGLTDSIRRRLRVCSGQKQGGGRSDYHAAGVVERSGRGLRGRPAATGKRRRLC